MFSRNTQRNGAHGDEEEALMLAALQRSPTYDRARTALFRNAEGELSLVDVRRFKNQEQKQVLDKLVNAINEDIEGVFKRVRQRFDALTLLLGPPSSGKTTFLLALAGRLAPSLQMSGKVTYNGHNLEEFTPQRTSAYASQQDWHISEMTVRKFLNFPDAVRALDLSEAVALGQQTSVHVEYIMKILGLDICADTLVGDEMLKGISGGQKSDSLPVMSEKDQEQYWFLNSQYSYVPVSKFVEDATTEAEFPVFIFKFIQLLLIILIMMSVFFRTTMRHNTLDDGGIYLGALYFAIVMILFNGFMEVPMLIAKLPVIYKHRDLRFYPCWVYTLPSWLLSIPLSLLESFLWVAVTYYAVGFDPQITRCVQQFLLYFTLHQMSIGLFRVMASLGRNMVVANTFGSFAMLVVMVLGGFILSRDSIPVWWIWGYWFSPMMYAQSAASVNEFLGHSWDKKTGNDTPLSLGEMLLKVRSLFPDGHWYWIGVGALLGYTLLFNTLFTLFLTHLNPLGKQQAVISTEDRHVKDKGQESESSIISFGEFLQHSHSFTGKSFRKHRGMVLPFEPLSMCFSNISYYVDVPMVYQKLKFSMSSWFRKSVLLRYVTVLSYFILQELKGQGLQEDRLQLLVNVTGAFRPGVLTALIGVSGAGKTTLMDVLAGRKTGGHIEGSIHISGYPKNQETFARISGYCEQNDVHSPCLTAFVDEVMELVELTPLRRALVGVPGVNGLSVEQRKRLTIAVELVANPSIVFMDEPTSGLDARSAAIVMRAVRNIVDTGRTIVCTIHQPSIDIFESFDELLLMKRGGQLIYAGPLGNNSIKLVEYFEAIPGVQKIRPGYNPAAWILEVTSPAEENRFGLDFAKFIANQICFSKCSFTFSKNLSYWRNPQYTAVRFFYTVIISLMFGTICWKFGSKRETQQDIFNAMGSMYAAVLFIGITNATSVQPVVFVERSQLNSRMSLYSRLFTALSSTSWQLLNGIYGSFFGMYILCISHYCTSPSSNDDDFCYTQSQRGFHPCCAVLYDVEPFQWLHDFPHAQYGDMSELVRLTDGVHSVPIKQLLKHQFGFRHDFLGVAGVVVVGFGLLFASTFAFAIRFFNFQRR
ncbi:hypothetical protein DH2020_046795 [Rehmannia glutinosa]|uniref:ABC transporter domain-containing protein n=1 Tax=Rehmannia glutinosa TaxID=99300 RepID=A0ABR0UAA4_REHGL